MRQRGTARPSAKEVQKGTDWRRWTVAWQELRPGNRASWYRRRSLVILLGMSDVTRILSQIELGDPLAAEELRPLAPRIEPPRASAAW